MTKLDVKAILGTIHANNERLQSCDLHRFAEGSPGLGKRFTCLKCAGDVDASALLNYCEGYRHAGKDPRDIWPSFEVTKSRLLDVIAKL